MEERNRRMDRWAGRERYAPNYKRPRLHKPTQWCFKTGHEGGGTGENTGQNTGQVGDDNYLAIHHYKDNSML